MGDFFEVLLQNLCLRSLDWSQLQPLQHSFLFGRAVLFFSALGLLELQSLALSRQSLVAPALGLEQMWRNIVALRLAEKATQRVALKPLQRGTTTGAEIGSGGEGGGTARQGRQREREK